MLIKAIHIEALAHAYNSSKNSALENGALLHNGSMNIANWEVDEGEHIFLYGDSGSGKTTLLNLLSGILPSKVGSISIFGENICSLSNRKRDLFRAKTIGVVFQRFNLIAYLSVLKNIQLAAYLAKNDHTQVQADTIDLLIKLKLPSNILYKKVDELSVGQQQRVAIVRALINRPKLLLVDEPTSALDAGARDAFMNVLMEICTSQNTTMIFVSHDAYLKSYFSRAVDIRSITQTQKESPLGEHA